MNFLVQLLRGISFIPALVSGIEDLVRQHTGSGEERRGDVVSGKRAEYGGRGGGAGDCRSGEIQRRDLKSYRRDGGMPECVHVGEGELSALSCQPSAVISISVGKSPLLWR